MGALGVVRELVVLAEDAGEVAMTLWGLAAGSLAVKTQGRYADALGCAERAVALAFDPPDHQARFRHPHLFLGMALADCDRLDEARQAYGRSRSPKRSARDGLSQTWSTSR